MSKIPNFDEHFGQSRIDNRMLDVLPADDRDADVAQGLRSFVVLTMDEADPDTKEEFVGNMGELLEKLEITAVESGNSEFSVADLNKLAEQVDIPGLPDFNDADNDAFYNTVSPFAEKLLRSEEFWSIVDERKLHKSRIIDLLTSFAHYGEIRTQLHFVKRLRAELESIIEVAKNSEAKLQGELDAFGESEKK